MIIHLQIRRESLLQIFIALVSAIGFGWILGNAIQDQFSLIHALGLAMASFNLLLVTLVRTLRKRPPQKIIKGEDPKHVRLLESRMQSLQWQVELLTALREMSRVVSDDVNFEKMMSEVFVIIDGILNTDSMTLFIPDEEGNLIPSARKLRQKIQFNDEITEVDLTNVYEAAENRCTLRILEDERLHIAMPLVADTEFIGVLCLELRLYGDPEHRQQETERYESILMDMVKHIALVIKTDNLHTQGIMDGLTGLYSKRHFITQLSEAHNLTQRSDTPLSLIMVDIDHFKKVNDTHGHLTGDIILKNVSGIIKGMLRNNDRAYRFGGEEISILLSGSNTTTAFHVAERIRQRVEQEVFTSESGGPVSVTLSLGISTHHPTMTDPLGLVSEADKALYACKENGRNQTRIQGEAVIEEKL